MRARVGTSFVHAQRPDYVVGLGSNLGPRLSNLRTAVALLAELPGCALLGRSSVYESEPLGPPQPHYLNAAVALATPTPPRALLDRLLELEVQLGRERRERWGPRHLDLDILWAATPVSEPGLTVPHPELMGRWFALAPLLEAAPQLAVELAASGSFAVAPRAPYATLEADGAAPRRLSSGALRIERRERTVDDALSAALDALGSALWPQDACGATHAQVVLAADNLQMLLEASLRTAGSGFAWRHALVEVRAAGKLAARLLGCDHASPRAPAHALTTSLATDAHAALATITIAT